MKEFTVSVVIAKSYHINVSAVDGQDAEIKVGKMSSLDIAEQGSLQAVDVLDIDSL